MTYWDTDGHVGQRGTDGGKSRLRPLTSLLLPTTTPLNVSGPKSIVRTFVEITWYQIHVNLDSVGAVLEDVRNMVVRQPAASRRCFA